MTDLGKLRGLQGPLQRGAQDFVVLEGADYVNNRIETLLAIHSNPWDGTGELEWDPSVGTMTESLRHQNITRRRLAMLTLLLADQLRKAMPEIVITAVRYRQSSGNLNAVAIGVSWAWPRQMIDGSVEVQIP